MVKLVLHLSSEKDKNKQKEAGFASFLDKKINLKIVRGLLSSNPFTGWHVRRIFPALKSALYRRRF